MPIEDLMGAAESVELEKPKFEIWEGWTPIDFLAFPVSENLKAMSKI